MESSWYLVKFVPDLFRNEPENIGLIVVSHGDVASRFRGQDAAGRVDGRKLPRRFPPVDIYRGWIDYLLRVAERGELDVRLERLSRRIDSIVVERRGSLFGNLAEVSAEDAVRQLYPMLVDEPVEREKDIVAIAESIVARLAVEVERDVPVKVVEHGIQRNLRFDYRYRGHRTALMDRLPLATTGRRIEREINEMAYRLGAVQKTNDANLLVLYSPPVDDEAEAGLRLIEQYAHTIEVTSATAPEDVANALEVDLLPA